MKLRVAIVGDVHEQWDERDRIALQSLAPDLVLFVGDFGNEAVSIVQQVASLDLPKAVILGNHDAWYSATQAGRDNAPYDRTQEDRLQQQLDLLGEEHVGYSKLEFPTLNLTVVGGRPFSWGGSEWKNKRFYRERYGIHNLKESIDRIVEQIKMAQGEHLILMAHNGPSGLGDRPRDPCGKDWNPVGGDHGDPDLEAAIAQAQNLGKSIALVTFGHMHHQLRHLSGQRCRFVQTDYTTYLNAACVPRVITSKTGTNRSFNLVTLEQGKVLDAAIVWLNDRDQVIDQDVLF